VLDCANGQHTRSTCIRYHELTKKNYAQSKVREHFGPLSFVEQSRKIDQPFQLASFAGSAPAVETDFDRLGHWCEPIKALWEVGWSF
jgi:hypothetical protein